MEQKINNIEKKELREKYLKIRSNINSTITKRDSEIISKKIISHHLFQKARNIMIYLPFKNEVDIKIVIESAWDKNKQVLAPKIEPSIKKINPYIIKSWNDLELGFYQIYEPKDDDKNPFPIEEIELVLVPGVAFDKNGYRLGYGGGYFDRFFDQFNIPPYRLAVAFDFQVVDQIPIFSHDIPMNEIITEKKSYSNR